MLLHVTSWYAMMLLCICHHTTIILSACYYQTGMLLPDMTSCYYQVSIMLPPYLVPTHLPLYYYHTISMLLSYCLSACYYHTTNLHSCYCILLPDTSRDLLWLYDVCVVTMFFIYYDSNHITSYTYRINAYYFTLLQLASCCCYFKWRCISLCYLRCYIVLLLV